MELSTTKSASQITLEYTVLVLVIVGLLFSNAEGVNLQPFSDNTACDGQSSGAFLNSGSDEYNPAIQQFGTDQNPSSQHRKELCHIISPSFEGTKPYTNHTSNKDGCFASNSLCSASDASSIAQGRAPPRFNT